MSALSDIQKLILWCRKNGVAWNQLACGSITIDGSDLKLAETMPKQAAAPEKPKTIFEQYGAALLEAQARAATEDEGMTSVVEEEAD